MRNLTNLRSTFALAALLVLTGWAPAARAEDDTAALYKSKCQSCHLADGNSPLEPLSFADSKWKHGSAPAEVAKVISDGVPATAMLPFKTQLTPEQIEALAEYVRSFDKSLKDEKDKKK
jgi:mono/diheme cytochrome c family protein